MTDPDVLGEMLKRAADPTRVGPAPIAAITARARRRRRRRAILTAAVTSVIVIGAVAAPVLISPLVRQGPAPAQATSHLSPQSEGHTETEGAGETNIEGDWIVEALLGADGRSLLSTSDAGLLRLSFRQGALTGTTECNSVFGTYLQTGDHNQDLRFPPEELGSSAVGCSEAPLVSRLVDVRHVSGKADIRYLRADNWTVIVQLRRVP